MDKLVKGLGGKVYLYLRDGDGGLVDADNAVNVAVTDGAGAVAVPVTSAIRTGVGTYELAVNGAQAAVLDTYKATWSGALSGSAFSVETVYEVVGGHLFGVADLRDFDESLTATAYPGAAVRKARDEATAQLERPGTTFGSARGVRVRLDGSGTATLQVPHTLVTKVIACTVDGVTIAPSSIAVYGDRRLVLPTGIWSVGARNVSLHYEAGWPQTPPPLSRAAKILARDALVGNTAAASMRATAQITGDTAFRLTIPGRDGWTGIPIVDEAIREYLHPGAR